MRSAVDATLTAVTIALAVVLAPSAAARAPAEEQGVCILYSEVEAPVVGSAQRTLGTPALQLDVGQPGQRASVATRCGRLVVALGDEAERAAREKAPAAPRVHALARGATGAGTGVAADADPRRTLQTLRELAPGARRVGVVYDPERTGALVQAGQAVAAELGLELVVQPVRGVGEAIRAYQRYEGELAVDAIWLLPDGTATVQETAYYALELAHWRRLVVIGLSPWYVSGGALFALVPRPESAAATAGELGALVLEGKAPGAEVRAKDELLYLNSRAASRLGLKVPQRLLDRAEQVFQ